MIAWADILAFEWPQIGQSVLSDQDRSEMAARCAQAQSVMQQVSYADVPPASDLHLCDHKAEPVTLKVALSPGLASPMIEAARKLHLFDDFKPLSDLMWRNGLDENHIEVWRKNFASAGGNEASLIEAYIDATYKAEPDTSANVIARSDPLHLASGDAVLNQAFDAAEAGWCALVKPVSCTTSGSALPTPYPITVPAGRFQESYYWDTAFGVYGLLATGRLALAQMQADNFLELIRLYGFIPNGTRDYYLSRSQPPLSAHMIRLVVEATIKVAGYDCAHLQQWLQQRAVPLLAAEFLDFWSDPQTRFDANTGLHHHWDAVDAKRPERHGADSEPELGLALRDVRAMAESGLDFTRNYHGPSGKNEISHYATVMLNGLLAGFAQDVAWLAALAGLPDIVGQFERLAATRKAAIRRHLWDDVSGHHCSVHLPSGDFNRGVDFTIYTPLFVGIATSEEADRIVAAASQLTRRFGVAVSDDTRSPHQWDGANGWAPAQIMAVRGLQNYGFEGMAQALANAWVGGLAKCHQQHGGFFERINLDSAGLPDYLPHQYPVQQGFLWTNASLAWMCTDVLNLPTHRHACAQIMNNQTLKQQTDSAA